MSRRSKAGSETEPYHEAIKELKKDNIIIILPADKGNATVVMDREEYNYKMRDLTTLPRK